MAVVFDLHLFVVVTELAKELHAPNLAPHKVVGVIHHAHLVGLGIANAERRAGGHRGIQGVWGTGHGAKADYTLRPEPCSYGFSFDRIFSLETSLNITNAANRISTTNATWYTRSLNS